MSRYVDADQDRPGSEARILVRLSLGLVPSFVLAVVDTAAPWCIFGPDVGQYLKRAFWPVEGQVSLSTRIGLLRGDLYRVPLTLLADEGENLEVEATVFLSPDWRGPNFIGYEGLLQRIRFAVDPETNLFYFGQI
jgi:hypothetical protein